MLPRFLPIFSGLPNNYAQSSTIHALGKLQAVSGNKAPRLCAEQTAL
jgi:hypothetical protein